MKTIEIKINYLIIVGMTLALPLFFASQIVGASTGTVNATVTPQNIAVSVSDGSVDYGTLSLGSSQDTTSSGVDNTQVATNTGNVTEDFNIRSSDATGGTTWTLAGSAGPDQFAHLFCNSGAGSPDVCDSDPTWSAMSTNYSSLATAVAPDGTNRFDLKIDTPTSSSDFGVKTIIVTIQAVQN